MGCQCYLQTLSPLDQFTLRWGAHATNCPAYRESLDPVDRIKDHEVRARQSPKLARRQLPCQNLLVILSPATPVYLLPTLLLILSN